MTGSTGPNVAAFSPFRRLARVEEGALAAILLTMTLLPVLGVLLRWATGHSIAAPAVWTQNLNLWLALLGAVVAARTGRHLALSTGEALKLSVRAQGAISTGTSAVASSVTAMLAIASAQYVRTEMDGTRELPGGVPLWVAQLVLPIGFALAAFYLAWTGNKSWKGRLVSAAAVVGAVGLSVVPLAERSPIVWALSAVLLGAVALGAPIYTIMGGLAMVLFYGADIPISAVPVETVQLVSSPTLPAIPLFTLAGYLLAEGGASRRLVALFQTWFGWLPGGIAAASVLVCAFFTTFTGASGVTILALGGLLLPVLRKAGYSEKFAIGLLIASGSIGLLFPPSLPVILYGVVSHVPIDDLFIAGAVPGALLVGLLVMMGVRHAHKSGVERSPFDFAEAKTALWEAKWEAAIPLLVLVGIFGGFLTIFEAAACTAAYALLSEVVIHRDISPTEDLPRVLVECGTLMGGVLVILGVALGFTNYLVDTEVPMLATKWAQAHVGNKIAFLLLLNGALLVVGCLMDIFSAIVVVVPLIVPIAEVFGVHPIHLGILFLANLELGYLTPPVGMNLFLASYRFDKPLTAVYRMALPFLFILLIGVLTITYVPQLTMWPTESSEEPLPTGASLEEQLAGPEAPPGEGSAPALPLGNLDLDALLSGDDDDSGGGDDDSAK